MSGTYGDMLSFFPELLRPYRIFKAQPKLIAGYEERAEFVDVWGYLPRNMNGKMSVISELANENQLAEFYTPDEVPSSLIKQGMWVVDSGELFKFIADNNYAREGGYACHKLQLITGPTDKQIPHPVPPEGEDGFN